MVQGSSPRGGGGHSHALWHLRCDIYIVAFPSQHLHRKCTTSKGRAAVRLEHERADGARGVFVSSAPLLLSQAAPPRSSSRPPVGLPSPCMPNPGSYARPFRPGSGPSEPCAYRFRVRLQEARRHGVRGISFTSLPLDARERCRSPGRLCRPHRPISLAAAKGKPFLSLCLLISVHRRPRRGYDSGKKGFYHGPPLAGSTRRAPRPPTCQRTVAGAKGRRWWRLPPIRAGQRSFIDDKRISFDTRPRGLEAVSDAAGRSVSCIPAAVVQVRRVFRGGGALLAFDPVVLGRRPGSRRPACRGVMDKQGKGHDGRECCNSDGRVTAAFRGETSFAKVRCAYDPAEPAKLIPCSGTGHSMALHANGAAP
ncbi:hypothetical protein LX36DRAFT_33423 [Colletotrichum falcatum]|nr:hypothetical protein LX36DRAFT_33423 [Colletotrichum falcatum]